MTAPDPFADDPIERDGYGRAKIIPVGRGGKPNLKAKLVPYTRVSTYADALSDAGGLVKWSKWHLALGLGRNPDLAALAGAYGPTVDDLTRADKAELDAIIERAHDRSGGNVKADYGTAVHAYTEPGAQQVPDPFGAGPTWQSVDELTHALLLASIAADRDAYLTELARYGLEVIDTEQFVVNDEVQAAGTYDHTVRLTRDLTFDDDTIPAGAVLVLDKKTGKLHLDSQCIQLATYANARRYDPETGERAELGASLEWGVIAHIPKGEARCVLHLIDLRVGWAAAKLAGKVREHRTRKDIGRVFPTPEPTEPASDALAAVEPPPPVVADRIDAGALAKIAEGAEKYAAALAKAHEQTKAARTLSDAELRAQTTPPADDMAEAVATVTAIFPDAEEVPTRLQRLAAADSRNELSAIWAGRATDGDGEWTEDHTAALRARAAELEQAA